MVSNELTERRIYLKVYGIEVTLTGSEKEDDIAGYITSDLLDTDEAENKLYNAAMDTVESFVLACACAGLDIESPAFLQALETTVNAINDNTV